MSFLDRLTGFFSSRPAEPQDKGFQEAAGSTVDPDDEEGWRPLSGDARRDLTPMTQLRMQKLAVYAWESNLLANRLIELPVAYLLAEGVRLISDDEDAQTILDRHWRDPINLWNIKLTKRVRELAIFGEQCYPTFVDERTGFVRLGYLDPSLIETVVTDPDNREQPIGIVTIKDKKGKARRYRVIVNGPETVFSERTRQIRETFDTGECFYFRVNELSAAKRGRSDLLAQIDWLDAYDQFMFGQMDRYELLSSFIWDVTLKGATPEDVKKRAKDIVTPKPGSVRVHNDTEEWKAEAPTLGSGEAAEAARLFRNHMLGGATVPEHWYGGASDVNRSTGESMSEPTLKMLTMRQSYVGYMLTEIGIYVLRQAWFSKTDALDEEQQGILDNVRVDFPEITAKDTSKFATALQQVVAAVAMAIADGLLSRKTAVMMIAAMAKQLGVAFDAEEELQAALDEYTDALNNDRFKPVAAAP